MLLKDIELIIFDLDGVLIDSKRMYLYIDQKVLAEQGYNYSYKQVEPYLGQKTEKVISDLIPEEDRERIKKIQVAKVSANRLSSSEEGYSKVVLLPHGKETIEELKRRNYTLTLLTNSDRVFVEIILKRFSLEGYWNRIIAAEDGFKTKEDAILFLTKYFNVPPKRTVYVGDMTKDVEIARNVGCKIIAIPGWHTEEMLKKARPDFLIHKLKELI